MSQRELARIYDTFARRLYAYLVTLVHDHTDARDLLQDLFVKIARNDDCMNGVRDEKSFLFRIAHNLAIDFIRRSQARRRRHDHVAALQPVELIPDDPDAAEFAAAVAAALAELPQEQRAAVHLKIWGSLTLEEIGDVLKISPNTAASRIRYGISKLRDVLRPIYDEL